MNKKDHKLYYAGIGVVLMVALFFGFNYSAQAGLSFWGGIQKGVITEISSWVKGNSAPDFSVDDLMDEETFSAVTSPDLSSPYWCVNGVCTWYYSGTCLDATTTLFSIANPLAPAYTNYATTSGATTTVTNFTLEIDGASTSTVDFLLGTSTLSSLAYAGGLLSSSLIDTQIATGTTAFWSMGITTEGPVGMTSVGAPGFRTMQLAPSERITFYASSTDANDDVGGIIGGNNTFTCKYSFEITAPRR